MKLIDLKKSCVVSNLSLRKHPGRFLGINIDVSILEMTERKGSQVLWFESFAEALVGLKEHHGNYHPVQSEASIVYDCAYDLNWAVWINGPKKGTK